MKMNPPIRLVAFDLDGTLLRSDKTISARTLQTIQTAREQGVIVAIATGRMYSTARSYGKLLGLGDMPMVLYAGGLIQTVETGRKLYEKTISVEDAQTLLTIAKEKGWQMQTYIDDVLRAAVSEHWIQEYERKTGAHAVICGEEFYHPQGPCNKILSRGSHEELLQRKAYIEEHMPGKLQVLFSEDTFLEIMPTQVDKGRGLQRLADLFGVPIEETMAAGDSQNDIDMLKAAGLSVAMENAHDEIKAAADCVTASNDADGVAQAIEKFVL